MNQNTQQNKESNVDYINNYNTSLPNNNTNNNNTNNNNNNWDIINQINTLRSDIGFLTKVMVGFMSDETVLLKKQVFMENEIKKLRKDINYLKKKYNKSNKNYKEQEKNSVYIKKKYGTGDSELHTNNNSEIIVQIEPIDINFDDINNSNISKKNKSPGNQVIFNPFDKSFDKIFDMIIKSVKEKDKEGNDNKEEYIEESDEEYEVDEKIVVEELNIEINSIDDLINLSKYYLDLKNEIIDEDTEIKNKDTLTKSIEKIGTNNKEIKNGLYELNGKLYSINLETIYKLSLPLKKLKSMIGLHKVKDSILNMILYYIQQFEKGNDNMLHTVIEGPPGVGKTELGKIISEIYASMGIIKSNKFKIVRRTDLIGEYVGHTAHKTQRVIDEANGGVLFIDEAYSLGSQEGKDTFSKECIDTINQNLSEQKKNLIVIIAGYPNELEKCFFAYNPGLNRRFPFRYSIEGYNEHEMKDIFMKKLSDIKWKIYNDINEDFILNFFKNNISKFNNYGGDIENLIVMCKFCHSRRIVGKHPYNKKKLTKDDILNGMKKFIEMNKNNDNIDKNILNNMYL